jgi:glutaredoxin
MSTPDDRTHLYWATGCTSCLRAKEFLERNDVPFVSHNVAEDMSILDRMESRGLPRQVPVVRHGDDWADAQDLQAVARIAGVDHETELLPVDELYRRLGTVLDAVERYTEQLPADGLDGPIANRPRTVGQLVFHTYSIPESFLEHEAGTPMESYEPEPEWANLSTDALVTYGRHVRVRLRDWYEGPRRDRDWSAQADVYYGDPTVHEYFERTTWHAGQHARQLQWLLEERFDRDPAPLDPALWEGLPMPEQVWSDDGSADSEDDRSNIIEAIRES